LPAITLLQIKILDTVWKWADSCRLWRIRLSKLPSSQPIQRTRLNHDKHLRPKKHQDHRDDRRPHADQQLSLVSWLGPHSPFLFVWIFDTTGAVALSWCATLKKDAAYTLLNVFWVVIGIVGILWAAGMF
jgi:hypothetical protein